jgi:myosin heavy subunit
MYEAELGAKLLENLDFDRNDNTLELIFGKKKSVFSTLHDITTKAGQSSDPNATFDEDFVRSLKQNCGKHPRLDVKDKALMRYQRAKPDCPGCFLVEHYAAKVLYDANGWVDKNQDKVTRDMSACLSESSLMNEEKGTEGFLKVIWGPRGGPDASAAKAPSVFGAFKNDLWTLVEHELMMCNTRFVRCIKPNRPKKKNLYEADLVLTQLQYTGMLATLQIQKKGYPSRFKHQDYIDRYRCLAPDEAKKGVQELVDWINTNIIPGVIEQLPEKPSQDQLDTDAVRNGKKDLVLQRDWAATHVEIQAKEIKGVSAVVIQCAYRAGYMMRFYQSRVKAIDELRPRLRGMLSRLDYYMQKWGKLEVMSRSSLTRVLRASLARKTYYNERVEFFETINRHTVQNAIMATIKRQQYYEAKMKYAEQIIIDQERDRMKAYEEAARVYQDELQKEQAAEAEECELAALEEEYVEAIKDATALDAYTKEKQQEMEFATMFYDKATAAVATFHEKEEVRDARAAVLEENADRIGRAHEIKIREKMIENKIVQADSRPQVAPKMKELPDSMDDVAAWREYHHPNAPVDDLVLELMDQSDDLEDAAREEEEALERERDEQAARRAAELEREAAEKKINEEAASKDTNEDGDEMTIHAKATGNGVDLFTNIDPSTLNPAQKQEFLQSVAKQLGVEPSRLRFRISQT